MRTTLAAFFAMVLCVSVLPAVSADLPQSQLNQKPTSVLNYPRIVLYSVSWCPHCREAKEYFTRNNIPFINRDVELDETAMTDLTRKYKSQGVPVVVIGDDKVIIKGFSEERFKKAIKDINGK